MNKLYTLLCCFVFSSLFSQTTPVPDFAFENWLVSSGIDTNGMTGDILNSDAEAVTGTLTISTSSTINDMSGIEAFVNITGFDINGHNVESLDLSNSPNLTYIRVSNMGLKFLNLKNINQFNITDFQDDNNPDLLYTCVGNAYWWGQLWASDSSSTYIENCDKTAVPDVVFEQKLIDLGIDKNGLTGDIYNYDAEAVTTTMHVDNSGITDLSGIEAFINLNSFDCSGNMVDRADFSNNVSLSWLSCNNMDIKFLSVKGISVNLSIQNNPNLKILCSNNTSASYQQYIRDVSFSPDALLVSDCSLIHQAYVPDDNFETRLQSLGYDAGPLDDLVLLSNIESVTSLDVSGQSIADLTGIKEFKSVTNLDVSNNNLTTLLGAGLNLHKLPLTHFNCSYNSIADDYGNDDLRIPTLIEFNCLGNNIKNIVTSDYPNLQVLNASHNNLNQGSSGTFYLSGSALQNADIKFNNLNTLILNSNLTQLEVLDCSNNSISTLNTSVLTNIVELRCESNQITELDLSGSPNLTVLTAFLNSLYYLNIKNGNNHNMGTTTNDFATEGNFDLHSICVDSEAYANANWLLNVDNWTTFSEDCTLKPLKLDVEVYLQGPLEFVNNNLIMSDYLRENNLIPTTSPYADAATCQTDVFTTYGVDAIVDWVWVELRDKNDHTSVLYSTSALLQKDGDVVGVDGTSELVILGNEDDYYVAVNHRNHLGIMSATPISLGVNSTTIDFTLAPNPITYGTNAQVTVGISNNQLAMIGGDYDGDGQILNADLQNVIPLAGTTGYSPADSDMDGQILNIDIQNIIRPNAGKGQQF